MISVHKDENIVQVDEKAIQTIVELAPQPKYENHITSKEELELIEKQYYALMNYAAKHSNNPKVNKEKIRKTILFINEACSQNVSIDEG